MARNRASFKVVFLAVMLGGLSVGPGRSDPIGDYKQNIISDYNLISGRMNSEFGRVFGFYSTLGWPDGPDSLDLIKGPHVEFGVGAGIDLVKINSKDLSFLALSPGSDLNIPGTLPLPFPSWHARVGIFKGLDFGFRGTGFPRVKRGDTSVANSGMGFALRYQAMHGPTVPDLSVQLTWDEMHGDIHFANDVNQQSSYTDGGDTYDGSITGTTAYEENWNVRSFGLKLMLGKTVGVFHPFAALGIQRYAGTVGSKLQMDLAGVLTGGPTPGATTLSQTLDNSAQPPITQPKFMVGFELGDGFYWSNLFESNGRDYAFSTGFRGEI